MKKVGLGKYVFHGGIRCFPFVGIAMLVHCSIEKEFDVRNLIITMIASILIPTVSWFGNTVSSRLKNKR